MGLPLHIDRVSVMRVPERIARLYAVVTSHPDEGTYVAEVFDAAGNRYVELSGYRTVMHPDDAVDPESLKTTHAALA